MKHSSYMDRALKAKNPRYARILEKLGYQRSDMAAEGPKNVDPLDHDGDGKKGGSPKPAGDDMKALRAEYKAAVGKKAFNGWDADTLRAKIAEAKAS